jgi:hypothetical protein
LNNIFKLKSYSEYSQTALFISLAVLLVNRVVGAGVVLTVALGKTASLPE